MATSSLITILTGPTASGKTAVALQLAELLNAEIINADSRQVYRGFDVGTAKPTPEERARVTHHGIDVCEPYESWTAGRFFHEAQQWIRDVQSRGKRVLVVGGSGLYVRVLAEGIFEGPPANQATRELLKSRLDNEGLAALMQELSERDPDMAATIDGNNPVRVLRALEVCIESGRPYSALLREQLPELPYRCLLLGIAWEREELYSRINARVDAMLEAGLEKEVRGLLGAGVDPSCLAMQSVGYKELAAYVSGSSRFDETVAMIKQHTRNFAKRQQTWFRRERGMVWFNGELGVDELVARCAAAVVRAEEEMKEH